MIASKLVRLANDVRGQVRSTEVKNFSPGNEVIERSHHLFDARSEVPPMDVQKINVRGLELLEGSLYRMNQGFCAVATKIAGNMAIEALVALVVCCVFCCEYDLITDAFLGQPFPNPRFRLFILVVIGSINEITARSWRIA